LISEIKKGISIGKLKTDIKLKLLFALEEIAETVVRIAEKPKVPKKITIKNCQKLLTRLPKTKLYII
jgi:hypothetical protein